MYSVILPNLDSLGFVSHHANLALSGLAGCLGMGGLAGDVLHFEVCERRLLVIPILPWLLAAKPSRRRRHGQVETLKKHSKAVDAGSRFFLGLWVVGVPEVQVCLVCRESPMAVSHCCASCIS